MADKKNTHDLVIIGAGPGGYGAAFHAADLGMTATLIDPRKNPGGVCLYVGCIPTKALLHTAQVKRDAKEAEAMGLAFKETVVDTDKVRKWKDKVVQELTGGLGQLAKQRKVNYIQGMARFDSSDTLEITRSGKDKKEKISFKKAIIATGSKPVSLPDIDFSEDYVMDSKQALELKEVPSKLLVIGAGYIGLEMSTIYHALGSKVSLVELTPHFLPGTDRDLVKPFEKQNKEIFEEIFLESKVTKMKKNKKSVEVTIETQDGKKTRKFDKILLSVGRRPLTEDLGLKNTEVKTDKKNFIQVDEQRKTDDKNIYAIGDVTGEPMLAHKATREGIVAAEAIHGKKSAFDPNAIPAVVYTDPEIAWTGLTVKEAEERGYNVEVAKFPWGASGRAKTLQTRNGITKLIIDKDTDRILGVAITGKNAGELIAEGTLAVEMAALASDLSLTIHPHPTLSETLMEAAEAYYGHSTHMYKPKKK